LIPKNDYNPVYQPISEPNPVFVVDLEKVATYTVLGLLTIASIYALVQSGGMATPWNNSPLLTAFKGIVQHCVSRIITNQLPLAY
jgi:hypothetical protein